MGAFTSPNSQQYDAIATNHIQEIAMRTSDVRFIAGRENSMADFLSRPPHVPIGTAYQLPEAVDAIASFENVALEVLDHRELAKEQAKWDGIVKYKEGKCNKNLLIEEVEFSPGVTIFCAIYLAYG